MHHQKPIEVETFTQDRYGRTIGTLWYKGRDINLEMVREGYAWVYRKYVKDQTYQKARPQVDVSE